MENLDLTNYIQQVRRSGMGDNKIREGLLQAGWLVSSIEEAMVRVPIVDIPQSKPKAPISKFLVVIFSVTVTIVGYFAGAYYMANFQGFPLWPFEVSVPVPIFTLRPTNLEAELPSDISNWQTYHNEEYGFEFKYPNAWNISSISQKNSIYALGLDSTVQSHDDTDLPYDIEISVYSNISDLDYQKLGVKNLNDFLNKYSDRPDPKFINVKSITINQELGYQADSGPNSFAGGTYYYFFNETYIYEMFDFGDLPEFDRILSTFRFIEPISVEEMSQLLKNAREYVKSHSALGIEFNLELIYRIDRYARFNVVATNQELDQVQLIMENKDGVWTGVAFGTVFPGWKEKVPELFQ